MPRERGLFILLCRVGLRSQPTLPFKLLSCLPCALSRMSQMARQREGGSGRGRPVGTHRHGTSQALPSLAALRQKPFTSEFIPGAGLTAVPGRLHVLVCACVCSMALSNSAPGAPPPAPPKPQEAFPDVLHPALGTTPAQGLPCRILCCLCFCVLLCLRSFLSLHRIAALYLGFIPYPFPSICPLSGALLGARDTANNS